MTTLSVAGLTVAVGGTEILHGIDLEVRSGEVHAVMGPNGAGKSTLGHALMGHPGFEVMNGSATLDGEDLLGLPTWRRAALGLFLAQQHPIELPGVRLVELVSASLEARERYDGSDRGSLIERIARAADALGLPPSIVEQPVNVGASGGERKRLETLQLAVLEPSIALLDELDSGLDIDAMREVARRIELSVRPNGNAPNGAEPLGVLAITHYNRLLTELRPDRVHVLVRGTIVESGGPELALTLERTGYGPYLEGDLT
ncbi:MAG TPA: Fe-S cluster assembly ATPase SufC [Acidimicrobiales bacterium]|nr:Fe-S cluster assembly ATPase SufC [Acidimicrobiales bacterium]